MSQYSRYICNVLSQEKRQRNDNMPFYFLMSYTTLISSIQAVTVVSAHMGMPWPQIECIAKISMSALQKQTIVDTIARTLLAALCKAEDNVYYLVFR